jgi:peptide/nickel transport system permease protein
VAFLVRRLLFAPVTFFVVAAITYLIPRGLRPELYTDYALLPGVAHDLERLLLHLDPGQACGLPGCPAIHDIWLRGMANDLYLLGGALVIGVGAGVAGGLWCAPRRRSLPARGMEASATLAFCTPVFVVSMGLLLLFNSTFGIFPLPGFFDAEPRWPSPLTDPWTWFRSLLVPWIVLAAPLGAMCLRLTIGTVGETLEEDYVRTAIAKGLPSWRVLRRHAAPPSHVTTASLVGVSLPLMVTNMVLVERVLAVPGFFRYTWKALGHTEPPHRDYVMLSALTLWGAVLIIAFGVLVDAAILWLDPRIRAAGRRLG